jgi:hypothetical protein
MQTEHATTVFVRFAKGTGIAFADFDSKRTKLQIPQRRVDAET